MTREEAIGHIKDVICENNSIKPNIVVFEQEKEALYMAIKALEQEPKTGHWIDREIYDADRWKCSECGRTEPYKENFCPNCGARMGELQESEVRNEIYSNY